MFCFGKNVLSQLRKLRGGKENGRRKVDGLKLNYGLTKPAIKSSENIGEKH
jgi:hypothetical protein